MSMLIKIKEKFNRYILVPFFILSLSAIAYAEPVTTKETGSDLGNTQVIKYLAPDLEDAKLMATAELLASASYTTTDIYNLLYSFRDVYSNTPYFRVYDNYNYNLNNNILSQIRDLTGYNTAYNTHSMLVDIWDKIGGNYNYSLYQYVRDIESALTFDNQGQEVYNVSELLWNIWDDTSKLSNIYSTLTSLSTKIDSTNSLLASIATDTYQINSKLTTTNDTLSSIDNKLNFNWNLSTSNFLDITDYIDNDAPPGYFNYGATSQIWNLKYNLKSDLYYNEPLLIRIKLPIQRYAANSIDNQIYKLTNIYTNNGNDSNWNQVTKVPEYYIETTDSSIYLYLWQFVPLTNYTYSFEISCDYNMTYYNTTKVVEYLKPDTLAYHQVLNSILDMKYHNTLKKFEDIYASDDLIKAKEAQQDYENEVLEDFTGNGSAASTRSDKNGLKSVSSDIKSGFNSGGSIGNALNIFNGNNSLWQFFTSTTQNNVNPSNRLRSNPSNMGDSDDYIIDAITPRNEEYYRILGNE